MARNPTAMRGLSIAHIVIGCILLGFGVADHQVGVSLILNLFLFTRDVYFGVWSGVWMVVTGIVGIIASVREINGVSTAFTGIFMFFCIISIFIALGIVGSYGYVLSLLWPSLSFLPTFSAIVIIIFLLGIAQFIVGLWGAISCCQSCCGNDQPGQVHVFAPNTTGYVMTQGAVAVPVQAGGGMVAPQGIQPEVTMMTPTSPPEAMTTGDPSVKQAEMPPSYGYGQ